jgi:ribonuclease P protein component
MAFYPVWKHIQDRKSFNADVPQKGLDWLSNTMLQRDYRLPIRQKTPPLFVYKTPYFIAKVYASTLQHPRFGFIVSKKTAPHAVTRNRVKRQLRGNIEAQLSAYKGGYDILFIVQKGAVGAKSADIRDALHKFFTKHSLQ